RGFCAATIGWASKKTVRANGNAAMFRSGQSCRRHPEYLGQTGPGWSCCLFLGQTRPGPEVPTRPWRRGATARGNDRETRCHERGALPAKIVLEGDDVGSQRST